MKKYYDTLGLLRSASSRQIQRRTINLGKKLHPKINQTNSSDVTITFIDVVEAYAILNDNETKRVYDLLLDCENGIKNINSQVMDKYKLYIQAKSMIGRENGEYFANEKLNVFKEAHRGINWWDILTALPS